jgi:hypothetical protein
VSSYTASSTRDVSPRHLSSTYGVNSTDGNSNIITREFSSERLSTLGVGTAVGDGPGFDSSHGYDFAIYRCVQTASGDHPHSYHIQSSPNIVKVKKTRLDNNNYNNNNNPLLWSSGQSSWLQNRDGLCFQ